MTVFTHHLPLNVRRCFAMYYYYLYFRNTKKSLLKVEPEGSISLYLHAAGGNLVPSSPLCLSPKISQLIRQRVEEGRQAPRNEVTCAWLQSRSVSKLRIELSLPPPHRNLFPGLPRRVARSQIKCCIFNMVLQNSKF